MCEVLARDDFRPTASWDNLRLRAELLRRTRAFFEGRGFLEVETPLLSAETVVDRHLDPVAVDVGGRTFWLQTSPELCMKRLLADRAEPIYQITRSFRAGESGPLHNPEFTIVEWYRPGDGMAEGMGLLGDLGETLLGRGPAEQVSYADAFAEHVGLNPHAASCEELAGAARACGIEVPVSLRPADRDGWLDLLLVERIQPHLGVGRPVILYDYPASQAALARIRPDDPPVAERFELYAAGIELANGYHELLDPAELRGRIAEQNALRQADGKAPLPEPTQLLAAMESGLPPATGAAIGLDRVVMLAAGAREIAEVLPFPLSRA